MVRTGGFHPPNRGSIPRSATKENASLTSGAFSLVDREDESFRPSIVCFRAERRKRRGSVSSERETP